MQYFNPAEALLLGEVYRPSLCTGQLGKPGHQVSLLTVATVAVTLSRKLPPPPSSDLIISTGNLQRIRHSCYHLDWQHPPDLPVRRFLLMMKCDNRPELTKLGVIRETIRESLWPGQRPHAGRKSKAVTMTQTLMVTVCTCSRLVGES